MALQNGFDPWSGCLGAIVAALISIPGTYFVGQALAEDDDQRQNPGRVSIDPIGTQSFVGRTVTVQGEAEVPSNTERHLWIVVRVDVNNVTTYYPQGAATIQAGRWSCTVSLGSPADSDNGPYAVQAQLVDGATARLYYEYVRDELLHGDTNGIQNYNPDDVKRMESIPLQRDNRLPGVPGDVEGYCDGEPGAAP